MKRIIFKTGLYLHRWLQNAKAHSRLSTFQRQLFNSNKQPRNFTFDHKKQVKDLHIACILDDFSYHCFEPEARFTQLDVQRWKEQLEQDHPDFLFVESAWKGKDGGWYKKVSQLSPEIIELVGYAKGQNIPCVFWHKEMPVHFRTFLCVSKIFDVIFLTDANWINRYKRKTHDHVFCLPFACQPKIHKPSNGKPRKEGAFFAGSHYPSYRYPQRDRDFRSVFQAASKFFPVDIYDRNYGNQKMAFPDSYKASVKPAVAYDEVVKVYQSYKFGLNMNSVKDSPTMFARRVYEMLATETFVISNESVGMKQLFGDFLICSDDQDEIERQVSALLENPQLLESKIKQGRKEVLENHTYQHRLQYIADTLNLVSGNKDQNIKSTFKEFPLLTSKEGVLQSVEKSLREQTGGYYLALNPEKIMASRNNPWVKKMLTSAKFVFADGVGVTWAYKSLLQKKIERIPGVDLFEDVLKICEKQKKSVALFGSSQKVIEKTKKALCNRYPSLEIDFIRSGYGQDVRLVHDDIKKFAPALVFVALGSPKQEQWIAQNSINYPKVLFTGVGGTFDVVSGEVTRAPRWTSSIGLEWMFRILSEPRKRIKRVVPLFQYVWVVLKERLFS